MAQASKQQQSKKKKCRFTLNEWRKKAARDAKRIEKQEQECIDLEKKIVARESTPGLNLDTHKEVYAKVREANNTTLRETEEQARLVNEMLKTQNDSTLDPHEQCARLEELANELYRGTPGKYKGIKPPSVTMKCLQKKVNSTKAWVRSTSRPVLDDINTELGTKVDFSKLSKFEGGQWLQPYIPCAQGNVAGNSGVTVCTGCDLGQKSAVQWKAMGLPDATYQKIEKYAGTKYKGQTCKDANKALDNLGKQELDAAECDAIDKAVKKQHLESARDEWNNRMPEGGTRFEDLTVAQQTVIFSRTYHQGTGMPDTDIAQDFYTSAQNGDWAQAKKDLENYDTDQKWYQDRVKAEAALLE